MCNKKTERFSHELRSQSLDRQSRAENKDSKTERKAHLQTPNNLKTMVILDII